MEELKSCSSELNCGRASISGKRWSDGEKPRIMLELIYVRNEMLGWEEAVIS
jgi:hypothetical protein